MTTVNWNRLGLVAIVVVALALSPWETVRGGNLVTNGRFEQNLGNGQVGVNTLLTGWSVPAPPGSYTFLFAPSTADFTGANGEYGNLALWGPGKGVANGLPA